MEECHITRVKPCLKCGYMYFKKEEKCPTCGVYDIARALDTVDEIIVQTETKTLEEEFIAMTGGVEKRELKAWRE